MIEEKTYYKAILDNLTGGLIGIDTAGKVVYINRMAEQILHISAKECLNKKFSEAFISFPELKAVISETIYYKKTVRRAEIKISHAGVPMVIGYGTMLIRDEEKEYGYAVTFQDITFVSKK